MFYDVSNFNVKLKGTINHYLRKRFLFKTALAKKILTTTWSSPVIRSKLIALTERGREIEKNEE